MSGRSYSDATLKTLFALSGNRCAYPNCTEYLIVPGRAPRVNIAHIVPLGDDAEAPRYEPGKTASELNQESNLLLLCQNHHSEVDHKVSGQQYSSEDLLRWKQARAESAIGELREAFGDVLESVPKQPLPENLNRFAAVLGLGEEEIRQERPELEKLVAELALLVPDARVLLMLFYRLAFEGRSGASKYLPSDQLVNFNDLYERSTFDADRVTFLLQMLESHQLLATPDSEYWDPNDRSTQAIREGSRYGDQLSSRRGFAEQSSGGDPKQYLEMLHQLLVAQEWRLLS